MNCTNFLLHSLISFSENFKKQFWSRFYVFLKILNQIHLQYPAVYRKVTTLVYFNFHINKQNTHTKINNNSDILSPKSYFSYVFYLTEMIKNTNCASSKLKF